MPGGLAICLNRGLNCELGSGRGGRVALKTDFPDATEVQMLFFSASSSVQVRLHVAAFWGHLYAK